MPLCQEKPLFSDNSIMTLELEPTYEVLFPMDSSFAAPLLWSAAFNALCKWTFHMKSSMLSWLVLTSPPTRSSVHLYNMGVLFCKQAQKQSQCTHNQLANMITYSVKITQATRYVRPLPIVFNQGYSPCPVTSLGNA